jgi:threonine dehydrogenase-like Zn-dependent dehydrogenase
MRALVLRKPGQANLETIADPALTDTNVLLKVRMVGFCGSDLKAYRGLNPLVTYSRVLGHEVSATVVEDLGGQPVLTAGTNVTVSPYTSCGECPSCRRGRRNACQFNQTLGVQRDGALTEFIVLPREKLYPAKLTLKELCLVEPLTVGFHAVARGRVTAEDTVAIWGCGGVGLGVVAAARSRRARTIGIDVDDQKLELARMAGAQLTINSKREPLHERLLEMTDGRGPDVANRGDWHRYDISSSGRRGLIHEESGLYRIRKGTGQLRNPTVRSKRVGHCRLQKCTTRGFRGRDQVPRRRNVSR